MKIRLYEIIKKGLLLIIMMVSANMGAQNHEEEEVEFGSFKEVKAHMELVFSGLEKQRVPYGILLDKSLGFEDITRFDGVFKEPHLRDTVDGDRVIQIAATLSLAKMDVENDKIRVPSEDLEGLLEGYQASENVILSGVYYKYGRFKTEVEEALVDREGGVFYDRYVDGIWQNPYEVKQSFAVAPLKSHLKSLDVKLQFPKDLWWTNNGDSIRAISIDFGTGEGFRNLDFGGELDVKFPKSGLYMWVVKMDLVDGRSLYSQSQVNVVSLFSIANCDKIDFQGSRPYLNTANRATLQIRYARADCVIRKPLIVAEGYDAGINPGKNGLGESDLDIFTETYTDVESSSLIGGLNTYDIIYVNWESGADYLQRNAYLLQDIITYINRRKAESGSTESNVVLGQSMGGVIARYALRDMENRNEDHQTRLYISQDAPHQGAHIPEGVLIAAKEIAFDIPSVYFSLARRRTLRYSVRSMLQAAGTQQLVKGVNESSNRFENWQQELRKMGYPQKTRNITMSNGSGCGLKQAIDFEDKIVWGASRFNGGGINLEVYASPNVGDRSLVYYIRIYNRIRIWRWTMTNVLYRKVQNITSSTVPLDTYAGGNYDFKMDSDFNLRPFNFVPPYSSLDVGLGNIIFNEQDYRNIYRDYSPPLPPKQIPFDNFVTAFQDGEAANEKHLSFNRKTADWLAMELRGIQGVLEGCEVLCGSYGNWEIEGADVLCDSSRYSVPDGFGTRYWYISQGADLAMLRVSGNAVVLTAIPGKSGRLELSLDMSCGLVVRKWIWVGKPKLTFDYERTTTWSKITLKDMEGQGVTDISWERLADTHNNFCPISFSGSGLSGVAHGSCYNWRINVQIKAANACGTTVVNASVYPLMSPMPNYDGMYPYYRIQPQGEPDVYEVFELHKTDDGRIDYYALSPTAKVRFIVHTLAGQKVLETTGQGVDISGLNRGIYVIGALVDESERITLKVVKN